MLQKFVINKIIELLSRQFKLHKIMKYVQEPNELDHKVVELENQILKLEKDSHPPIFSKKERNDILRTRFTPLKVSNFVYEKVRTNAAQRGTSDPSRLIKFQTDRIYRKLFRNNLFDSPGELFTETINVIDDRTPTITSPGYRQAPNIPLFGGENQVSTPVMPNVTPNRFQNTGTLNPSDVSQLAKSGDIDITEAIAARRT